MCPQNICEAQVSLLHYTTLIEQSLWIIDTIARYKHIQLCTIFRNKTPVNVETTLSLFSLHTESKFTHQNSPEVCHILLISGLCCFQFTNAITCFKRTSPITKQLFIHELYTSQTSWRPRFSD